MTNSEKQERYRKKEALKKMAGEVAIRINSFQYIAQGKNPMEFQRKLETAINLPSNWTDEDYDHAVVCLKNLAMESYDNPNLLNNDIISNHNSIEDFSMTPNPLKHNADIEKAKNDSVKLANHILSAVELSGLSTADAVAAVIDALRSLGRILMDEKKIPESYATSWVLALIGQQYQKPIWFIERFAKTVGIQLGIDDSKALGAELLKFSI